VTVNLLAASGQRQVALAILLITIIGWGAYVLLNRPRKHEGPGTEIELAPNRKPYLDDEAMEGPRLDKTLTWGLLTLGFVAIALPVYWLREPGRQVGAERGFEHRAAHRGEELFASTEAEPHPGFGCADCHGGMEATGGATKFVFAPDPTKPTEVREVSWQAPALNTVLSRFSEEEVREVIIYGRPGTPMPAWGVEGGGPMNEQNVTDLLAYLEEIRLSPKEALEQGANAGTDGESLFNIYCARCHTKGWSYRDSYPQPDAVPGGGAFGPNLTGGTTLRQFPDLESHIAFITEGSEENKLYGVRGVGSGRMPGFGGMLSKEQIAAIVAYERSL
jgi:mono/diheme cytochrome c family protein